MSIGDDAFELSVTAVGRPVPSVVWSYKHVNESDIENIVDCVNRRIEAPEHNDNLGETVSSEENESESNIFRLLPTDTFYATERVFTSAQCIWRVYVRCAVDRAQQ